MVRPPKRVEFYLPEYPPPGPWEQRVGVQWCRVPGGAASQPGRPAIRRVVSTISEEHQDALVSPRALLADHATVYFIDDTVYAPRSYSQGVTADI